jgi:DNA-binding CsgD family transcriptional regulator/N-acetylneuraminic acid mutarotase
MIPTEIDLSEREREILRLVATGASNKQIAQDLFISTNTVKVHLRNIFAKIGVTSRTEATLYAIREGLVPTPGGAGGEVLAHEEMAIPVVPVILPGNRSFNWRYFYLAIGLIGLVVLGVYAIIYRTGGLSAKAVPTPIVSHWQQKAPLPTARSGLAAVAFNAKIYAIGGETKAGVTSDLAAYDTESDSWTSLAGMPTPVRDIGAVVVSGQFYVPGGKSASGKASDELQIYNPIRNTWEQGARLPSAIYGYALATLDGKIYLIGGTNGKDILSTVYVYSPDTARWEQKTNMPTARAYASAAAVNGKIFVMGGYQGSKGLVANEMYTPELDNDGNHPWEEQAALPAPRYGMGLVSQADLLYMIGGDPGEAAQNLPLVYQYRKNEWQEFEKPPTEPGSGFAMVAMDGYVYVLGGKPGSQPIGQNQVYRALFTVSFPIIPNSRN